MKTFWSIGLLIFYLLQASAVFSQTNEFKPVITGQNPLPLLTTKGTPITITLSNLIVKDDDPTPVYPNGFSLELNSAKDYVFQGTTVTPNARFVGTLKVRVRVSDGKNDSPWFDLKVDVTDAANVTPQITGQVPITTNQGQSVTITLAQLTVTDPDDNYPTGFSLKVYTGSNYTFNGSTITPSAGFTGSLTVPVSVNDGQSESKKFNLKIQVNAPQNIAPVITGQVPISINAGSSVTLALTQLIVNDPDDSYPTGFTLTIYTGSNYSISGSTVSPAVGFKGPLKVPVSVNDGEAESAKFSLTIDVKEVKNEVPKITGQTPLSIDQGESLTITLAQLVVTDPDNNYPTDFTLTVYAGTNYTISGTTVTPSPAFKGKLKVQVSVNDGKSESAKFDLSIDVKEVKNDVPKITGQVPLTISQGQSFTITLSHLIVTDSDNPYPNGFTLKVYSGNQYTVSGNTITPAAAFSGDLKVPVSVNDGQNESNKFDLKITITKVEATAPQITGQQSLSMNEDESITLKLSDLFVSDIDSQFPQDFTMKISPSSSYSFSGLTVTPSKNFSGILSVTITVNDGKKNSNPYDLQINVVPVNDAPVITGQKKLKTDQGVPLSIALSDLTVTDPDNDYPEDFTLKISHGVNYVVAGNTINPAGGFSGPLSVVVSVNDGKVNSPDFTLEIDVTSTKKNVAPLIVGQKVISITQNTSFTIQLFHLLVNDPDNEFPNGFALKVSPGTNYTLSGATITPLASFTTGTLSVRVRVNDGTDDSPFFDLKIQVTPISATPKINGQREIAMMEDSTISIALTDLIVTDADNPGYPNGFILKVLPNSEGVYKISGTTITPALNYNGFIEVGVTVSDGTNTSDEFKLVILVQPVNDAPEVLSVENEALKFEPGKEAAEIFDRMDLTDVDNDYISMAEVGFRSTNFSPENDELIFESDTSRIRAIHDPQGILYLIGHATVDEYRAALRSIKYNYKLIMDLNGDPADIKSGFRTVYINVNDGEDVSKTSERQIEIDSRIALDIPTAFTPNGDKANDTWHLELSNRDRVDQAIIKVYNKRGLLLYESGGFDKDWDGTFNGQVLPVDTYYYTIVVKLPYMRQTYRGVVTILY